MSGAISVPTFGGNRYLLPLDGIVDYTGGEFGDISYVEMSRGSNPIAVLASAKDLDRLYAGLMVCPLPVSP